MKKIIYLGIPFWVFFFLSFQFINAQSVGDFRSTVSGKWTSPTTWQRCTSILPAVWSATTEYPGSIPSGNGNYAVTVAAGTTVILDVATSALIGNLYVEGTLELKTNFTLTGAAKTIGVTNGLILFAKKVELRLPQNTVFSIDIEDSIMQGLHGYTPPGKEDCDATTAVMIWNGVDYDRYTTCAGRSGTTGMTFAEFNNTNASINVTASNGFSKAFCAFNITAPIIFSGELTGTVRGSTVQYQWQYYPPGSNVLSPLPAGVTTTNNTLTIAPGADMTAEGVYVFRLIFKYTAAQISLIRYADFYIYNGASSVWDGANWSYGVPTDLYPLKAVIDSNYSTGVKGSFSACSCTVNTNKILTISPNTYVNVGDNIINNGAIAVKSDGNLIQQNSGGTYTGTGTFTAERDITALHNTPTKMDYVFWSSPVASQNLQSFSPGTPAAYIQQYNEATDYFPVATGNFVKGKGYAIRAEVSPSIPANPLGYNKTYQFMGNPNNGDIAIAINRSPNTGIYDHGYNLVGNPYPSNISFDELYNANPGLLVNKVWFWTNKVYTPDQGGSSYDGSNYVVYTKGGSNSPYVNGIVKVGQGFIIQKLNLGPGTLTFKNNNGTTPIRVTDNGTFYQKNSNKNRFWLNLTAPDHSEQSLLIGYYEGAVSGFDDFDGQAFSLSPDMFYSVLNEKRLLVQGRSSLFSKKDVVPLGANFAQASSYTISLQKGEGIFENGQTVYLKDLETGQITNLSEVNYSFSAKAGENTDRFQIIYQPESVLTLDNAVIEELVIYRDKDDFIVKAQSKNITEVQVLDMNGRLILKLPGNETKVLIPGAAFLKGVYFVKVNQGGLITTKKIIK